MIFIYTFLYVIMGNQENFEGLKLNETYQTLFSATDVDSLGENTNMINKNTEPCLVRSKLVSFVPQSFLLLPTCSQQV
jgi:hypothetical protein